MPLIPLSFIVFFGGTYIFSTFFLRHEAHLHESKIMSKAHRR